MDLNTALSDSKIAIHLFFNNKFDEAQHVLEPWYVYIKKNFNSFLNHNNIIIAY